MTFGLKRRPAPAVHEIERAGAEGTPDVVDEVFDDGVTDAGVTDAGEQVPARRRLVPAGRGARLVAAVLVVVVLLGLGYAAGRLTPVLTAPGDGSAEAGFARDMSVHHGQAVHLGMVEYDRGQDGTLRRMAYDIATSQEYQIGVMEDWLREWRLPLTTDREPMAWVPGGRQMLQPDGRMPGLASNDELKRLETAGGRAADILFCQLMLRHHLGGIHMVEAILARTHNAAVRDLAERMLNAQQGEIDAMRELLKSFGAAPL